MREFPEYEYLEFMIGCTISNVILQPYTIDFTFDDNTFLTVEVFLEHIDENGCSQLLDIQKGYGPISLHKIVNCEIVRIERDPLLLTIYFKNDHVLKIISVPGPLESGHFNRHGEVAIF